ncbi:AIPR family protein [Sphingomonas sp. ZB1N12]|uniref:AIPR family protein n=1 Tax=Sphingomonas arabinosi TaxID=3096160 RepID=UPI002FCB2F3E
MGSLDEIFEDFRNELLLEADASGDLQADAFFNLYAAVASEAGEVIDLEHTPARREGGRNAWQVDGFAIDVDRGTLYVAICDFRSDPKLQTLNAGQIDSILRRVRNFIVQASDPTFINELEDTGAAFRAAYPIFSQPGAIRRVRIVIFSNARMSTKRAPQAAEEIMGRPVTYSVFDFGRYAEATSARSAPQPIEVNFLEIGAEPVPCLLASLGDDYVSYLVALPGQLLADIYGLYGARLLEQNVRTFLQAKTKVNRGIIDTLRDSPEMFFAFNNGLTATASAVTTTRREDGQLAISSVRDLQIVNGGQTTASILYAKDRSRADLAGVHVQMKLSVVDPALVEELVPRISRYANTQNRISEADFFSSHPFHVAMEQISRRLGAPPKPGALSGSKWFYERARGQYRDAIAYATPAQKRKHELEFPRPQLIDKTDLAKFETTFEPRPDIVSRGAQKCFIHFAARTAERWRIAQAGYNEVWYRNACARALVFRWTDRSIGASQWYADDRGYKSQTVAYTLSWLVERAVKAGWAGLNLHPAWTSQDVPEELAQAIERLAPQVALAIRDAPTSTRNVGEYCKSEICWERLAKIDFDVPDLPEHLLLGKEEAREEGKAASAVQRIDYEVGFDTLLVQLTGKAELIRAVAAKRQLLSPKSSGALQKIARSQFAISPSERKALQNLFERLDEAGAPVTAL